MARPGVLSDRSIRELVEAGRLRIEPWDPGMVQPASVDLKLGDSFRVFHNHRIQAIDIAAPPRDLTEHVRIADDDPFVIHPGEFVLGRTEERVELPDDIVARIEGKALALDTPVPTPAGWRAMGELEVGDRVFDPDGRPVTVTGATPVLTGRPCFEVEFSDGTAIIADAGHRWEVQTGCDRSRGCRRVLTTAEMRHRVRLPGSREFTYHVPLAAPVEYGWRELPVDPYVLGVRLGGGTTTAAGVIPAGRELSRELATGRCAQGEFVSSRLRDLNPLADERIPRAYLEASIRQRRELLDGLMDAGAHVDSSSRCGLTTTRPELAQDCHELVASLGFPRRSHRSRAIVGIRPVPSAPVRCIEVGSVRGAFLVSRSFITTHNSSLGRLGLIVHATAGFVDPGFEGTLTLEITNFNSVPIVLRAGLPIAQLSLMALDSPAERPYGHPDLGSHYHGQTEATESRYEGGPGPPAG